MSIIIDNIRAIRLFKGYTQDYMAQKLDIDVSTYGKIERGQIDLTVDRLELIAKIFEMEIADLFRNGEMPHSLSFNEENLKYDRLNKPIEVSLTIKLNQDMQEKVLTLAFGEDYLRKLTSTMNS